MSIKHYVRLTQIILSAFNHFNTAHENFQEKLARSDKVP